MRTIKAIFILYFLLKATQLKRSHRNEKIFNGFEARRGFYPFVVAIFANNTDNWEQVCGGVVIAHEWILTAVHCLIKKELEGPSIMEANELLVIAGTHRIKPDFDITHQNRSVIAYFYPNPDREFPIQSGYLEDDIALLQLKYPLEYNEAVNRIVIPKERPRVAEGTFAGWGFIKNSQPPISKPSMLQATMMDLIWSYDECKKKEPNAEMDRKQLCAYRRNTGACKGDSGGPLFRSYRDRSPVLLGLLSSTQSVCKFSGEWTSESLHFSSYKGKGMNFPSAFVSGSHTEHSKSNF